MQEVAQAAAKQLLETQNPMDLAKALFTGKDYEAEIQNLLGELPINKEVEKISEQFCEIFALEDKTKKEDMDILENKKEELMSLVSSKEQWKIR